MEKHTMGTSGVVLTLPKSIKVEESSSTLRGSTRVDKTPPKRRVKLQMKGRIRRPESTGIQDDDVIKGLSESGLTLVEQVTLAPTTPRGVVRAPEEKAPVNVAVPLDNQEGAVLLIEQDGVYSWQYADAKSKDVSKTRADGTLNYAEFTIDISRVDKQDLAGTRGIKEAIGSFVFGKVKLFVLKFLAQKAVEGVRNYLENDVVEGIVQIADVDPNKWMFYQNADSLNISFKGNGSKRMLLFVHGTFSSTVGGFGALGGTPWGIQALESAFETYDLVLGFNHFTLRNDPQQNAELLLDYLKRLGIGPEVTIDIISHSRGGLVTRCLIEKVLPSSIHKIAVDKVIFVGCTNEGTLLASPDNWDELVTLYTNLAVGASRALSIIAPHSAAFSAVLTDILKSIGSFIKYCASSAITDRLIPGLSAMEPTGSFIVDINSKQVGQPEAGKTNYFAITSDFQAQLGGTHEPKEFSKRLIQLLSSKFMTQLMAEANDLVVNVSSMTSIDSAQGNFVIDKYDFGINAQVYHTNYFTRPEVANALTRWLNLKLPSKFKTNVRIRPTRSWKVETEQPDLFSLYEMKSDKPTPPWVDLDILSVPSDVQTGQLKSLVNKKMPSYVVVQALKGDNVSNFAFKGEEILDALNKANEGKVVHEVLGLNNSPVWDIREMSSKSEWLLSKGLIVMDNNQPIGVVPPTVVIPNVEELAKLATLIDKPVTDKDRIKARRTLPTFGVEKSKAIDFEYYVREAPRKRTRSASIKPKSRTCFFYAQMNGVVKVSEDVVLSLWISRAALQALETISAAKGSAMVDEAEQLDIKVVIKKGFKGIDQAEKTTSVPISGSINKIDFKLTAGEIETDGEIWVLVRQGGTNVIKLVLKPSIVAVTKEDANTVIEAKSEFSPVKRETCPVHQLWITENLEGGRVVGYTFRVYSESLKINQRGYSKTVFADVDVRAYVDGIYQEIENMYERYGSDYDQFEPALRAIGVGLFEQLFPVEVQKLLWVNRDRIDHIQVVSDDPFIPWELIHLKDPGARGMTEESYFLGDMGLVRWLDGMGNNGWPNEKIKVRNDRVRYVIPNYPADGYALKHAQEEIQILEELFQASPIKPNSKDVREAITKPQFDLLHFACHGEASSKDIRASLLLMEGQMDGAEYILDSGFTSAIVKTYANLSDGENGPLVVLNACQAGRTGRNITDFGGFAISFLSTGASAFVGSLWAVGDLTAKDFAFKLYEELLNGRTLAEATKLARQYCKDKSDATWLAYVVYGNPCMRLVRV